MIPGGRAWRLGLAAAALLVALRLLGLGLSPPGLHQDEAAIGYDAWAIAHHGADEHGAHLPLFLRSFDDYKSPLYVYLLAPLTWFLPLTAWVIRLPAALCGLAACLLAALTAGRITGSRGIALLQVLAAATMPWLFLESRVAFEVGTLTLTLTAALWCLVRAEAGDGRRWFAAAGVMLGLAVFAYPSGRLLVALLLPCLALAHRGRAGRAGWWAALVAPGTAYALLGLWMLRHPGALTQRFEAISILRDGPGPLTAVLRFAGNYLAHLNLPFLLLRGDTNPRHSTGAGGLLLLATVPVLVTGIAVCLRHLRDPLPRLALLGLAAAPVPASLTTEGVPHAVRAAPMIPFLLLVMAYGWPPLLGWLRSRPRRRTALALLAGAQVCVYLLDLFITYPARADGSFDAGVAEAVVTAHRLAAGHPVLLSGNLGRPDAHALVELRPAPGADLDATLAEIGMRRHTEGARPGDLLVLSPRDRVPPGSRLLHEERAPAAWWTSAVVARVYRR